jgi:hypothetical protein
VLTAAEIFEKPKYLLSGLTGFVFKFVAHKKLNPSSIDVYSMDNFNWQALDNLGVQSEILSGRSSNPTFILYRSSAVKKIKESIDRGIGVLVWAPKYMEFGIIYGYDDEDGVFYYMDRIDGDNQIMLYANLGKNPVPFWHCQVIGEKIEKDIRDMFLDSLESGVDDWETPYILEKSTNFEFACGKKAYDYTINAFSSNNFHQQGACRILNHSIISKRECIKYMAFMVNELPEIKPIYEKYNELADTYEKMGKIVPPYGEYPQIKAMDIPELIRLLGVAREVEDAAIKEIKKYLGEVLNNRFIDVLGIKKF